MTIARSNYSDQRRPSLQILDADQLDKLHSATLEVMERTGCRIFDDEALALLHKAGAHISDGNRVRISPGLVEKALTTVPKRVVLCDRAGQRVLPLEKRNSFYGSGSDALDILDSRTDLRRQACLQDVVDAMHVCDAMPNIDFVMSMFMPWDVNNPVVDRYQMETMLLYSHKPIVYVVLDLPGCVDAVTMAEEVAGGAEALRVNPQICCYINVATPLRHNPESVQKLLYLAGKGLPCMYIGSVTKGTSGPITSAGAMVLANACQLTGLVLSQLKREGAPYLRGLGMGNLDMRTTAFYCAAPERSRGIYDLAHYYDLPAFGLAGMSDSKIVDEQAAIEASLTLLMDTLAGANLIHDVGFLEAGLLGSLDAVVMCDEIIAWIRRHLAPLEINEETIPLDLIDQIGPDGTFLDTEHTLRHHREEFYPRFMDRNHHDTWNQLGCPTMRQRVRAQVLKLLGTPAPLAVPEEVAERVRAVRRRAEAAIGAG